MRWTRREVLRGAAGLGVASALPQLALGAPETSSGVEVNDVQSQLNRTRVHQIVPVESIESIQRALSQASKEGRAISIAGGRHAMGGQQFGSDTLLLDMKPFHRVIRFDRQRGLIEVEAGMEWPELMEYLTSQQTGQARPWSIRQKQTGVDRVSLGGCLASNIHGRGLRFPPIVDDVESFVLIDASGKLHTCSRRENTELFSLAIGGYGLFGVIASVTLRLVPRLQLERVVEIIPVRDLLPWIDKRLAEGFLYGDCQYATFLGNDATSHPGVFSCYKPVATEAVIPQSQRQLSPSDWAELYLLARTDKKKAFERYSQYYRATSGQRYWSDTSQLAGSFDGHRKSVDARRGTEVITEVYVARDAFLSFMGKAREDFVKHNVDMTYGTIRFIEPDKGSFLAWAREPSVCIVCNLHVLHTDEGKRKAAEDFRRIIDRSIEHGGRYFLTYHRWATRKQVETCYPQFVEFLRLKRKYDPQERFQSDWYRHYKQIFADTL